MLNCVIEMHDPFYIDDSTTCAIDCSNVSKKEYHHAARSWEADARKISFCDIISFFCATKEGNYHVEAIDYDALSNENFNVSNSYNHIIPAITTYKKLIDEIEIHRDIAIEYLTKTDVEGMHSKMIHKSAKSHTYFQRLLHKAGQRINKPYIQCKLRKIFRF